MQNAPYQQMAKEFMDLWQKQIASVVSDKQFIQAMLEMFQSVQPGSHAQTHAKSADAAHAPDADPGLVAQLAFRVAMCEKRLSALEQGRAAPAKPAGKRTGGGSKKSRK